MTIRRAIPIVLAAFLLASLVNGRIALPRLTYVASAKSGKPKSVKRRKRPKNQGVGVLDPLRQIKFVKGKSLKDEFGPNIIIAIDRSPRMSNDFNGRYYDPERWDRQASFDSKKGRDPNAVAQELGVDPGARYYHRTYDQLTRREAGKSGASYDAASIAVVDELDPEYHEFYFASRLGMARDGLAQAVSENMWHVRVGLVASRQGDGTSWPTVGNEQPVDIKGGTQGNLDGDLGGKKWKVTYPVTSSRNMDAKAESGDVLVKASDKDSSAKTLQIMESDPSMAHGLKPFGLDDGQFHDSPITSLLTDTRAEVERVMDKDAKFRGCRNTAVILVVGGLDGKGKGGGQPLDPVGVASTFASVSVKGTTHRVPIYVIAMGPDPGEVKTLRDIAAASGGEYIEAYDANAVAFAANRVVQAVHGRATEFDLGLPSHFQSSSPVVGTVNLAGATDINGGVLSDPGPSVGQHSNLVVTGGFTLPGFAADLRAFRTFRAVADGSKQSGYTFVKDGTPLWVAHLPDAGRDASGVGNPLKRNLQTFVPGVGMVGLTAANAALLQPYLRQDTLDEAAELIEFVRRQPLGAVITSTPAIVNPPSLDPAPDADYETFAAQRADRRSLVYYGGNNGMLHAIDARLGVEVWGFVPFNLLPKLQTLIDGQGVVDFEYFVDASPKVADVKVGGVWRTYLVVGEGPGGTFYQALDISEAGQGVASTVDSEDAVLQAFADPNVIRLAWSFPSYGAFDPTISTERTPWGDLGAGATAVEKTVGETWSSPAIGQPGSTSPFVVVMGSGYLDRTIERQANRGGVSAGHALYVLDAASGSVLSSVDVGYVNDDGSHDHSSRDDSPSAYKKGLKNSLTADPAAIGSGDDRLFDRIYIGDTRGHMWRFPIGTTGLLSSPVQIYDAHKEHPIFASAAVANAGAGQTHVFFATGIDTLGWVKKLDKFVLVGLLDKGGSAQCVKKDKSCEKFEIKLEKADGKHGDERPTAGPAIAGNAVFFTTTTEMASDPCSPPASSLYALTFLGGPAYDTSGDGIANSSDRTVAREWIGRATAPYVADAHLYVGVGESLEVLGDPEGFNEGAGKGAARLLSWREVH